MWSPWLKREGKVVVVVRLRYGRRPGKDPPLSSLEADVVSTARAGFAQAIFTGNARFPASKAFDARSVNELAIGWWGR